MRSNGPPAADASELDEVGRVAESFLARFRRGERPSVTEYAETYPALAGQIRDLFPALVALEDLGAADRPRREGSFLPLPRPDRVPDRLGDYRLVRELGRGGMGVVYAAVQESLGRHVALKVLSPGGPLWPVLVERFRREARAAARLHHTNIVPVHGVGEHDGVLYYAMQLIDGRGLDAVLAALRRRPEVEIPPGDPAEDRSSGLAQSLLSGQFDRADGSADPVTRAAPPGAPVGAARPPCPGGAPRPAVTTRPGAEYFRSVARMGVQVATGLDYAHRQGVLHRDVKPSNLLLDARGAVWITDFGLAKAAGAGELTDPGDVLGTVRFMAPERFRGRSDARSDVYGLGVTLYELLTLRPAFESTDQARLIERVAHEEPPRPRQVDPAIPRDLETVVLKAMAKEPDRRYQTAGELAADLERLLAGEPIRARRAGAAARAVKWVRRRPAMAALLAVSAAAALTLVAGTLAHNARLAVALGHARLAEREQARQLAVSHLRAAQARRSSGLTGRRFDSLEVLRKAAALFRDLGDLDADRTRELRAEAIACLALADLKPGEAVTHDPGWDWLGAIDPAHAAYALSDAGPDAKGDVSVRRLAGGSEVARLPGTGARVVGARFSPDGRSLAVDYERGDRHSVVWDLDRREAVLKASGGAPGSRLAFSPDGRRVALALPDHSIRLWDLPAGAAHRDLPPGSPIGLLQFHPDGRRLTVASGRTVFLRDLEDGREAAAFKHPGWVKSLAWRNDGKAFAAGCSDHDICVWDAANPAQPLRVLKGHFAEVVSVAFSRGGDLLYSTSWDSTDRLWDPVTGEQLLSKPGGVYAEHHFAPGDRALDGGWQLAAGRERRTFHGGKVPRGAAVCPAGPLRGRLMATVYEDGVELWDLGATGEGGKLLATLPIGPALTVHFAPDGRHLIAHDGRAGLGSWPVAADTDTGEVRVGPPQSVGLSARAPFVAGNPDFALCAEGRTVAMCPHPGHAILFAPDDPRRTLVIESPCLRHVAVSPDGRWLAAGNWHGQGGKVWDARTGTLAGDLDLGDPWERAAWPAFSPDGRWLVTATAAEYRFWEVGTWEKRHAIPRANAGKSFGRLAFSADGSVLAVLHSMTEVRLVDPATGREFARLPTAGGPFCFSPDGSRLVTYAGRGGALHVWDLRLIRRQLAELGLDWDVPPCPPPPESEAPLRVTVVAAPPAPPAPALDAAAHVERGLLYVQLRQHAKALADFSRACAFDPERPPWGEAVRAFSRAIERHPDDAEAYHQRAHALERLGRWDEAIADHDRVVAASPLAANVRLCRGRAHADKGDPNRARAEFASAAEAKDASDWAWHHHALACLEADDTDGYRRDCATMLARFAEPAADATTDVTAWTCVVAPGGAADSDRVVQRARAALARGANGHELHRNLGAALYRAGRWEAAIASLNEAVSLRNAEDPPYDLLLLSMAHHHLGHADEARALFDRAVRSVETSHADGRPGGAVLPWNRRLTFRLLRREAEGLTTPSENGVRAATSRPAATPKAATRTSTPSGVHSFR